MYLPMATVILVPNVQNVNDVLALFVDSGKKWRRVVHLYTVYDLKIFVLVNHKGNFISKIMIRA